MRPVLLINYAQDKLMTQQTYSHSMAFPELVEGFQALNVMILHSSVEPVEHTPPLLHDVFVWQPYA